MSEQGERASWLRIDDDVAASLNGEELTVAELNDTLRTNPANQTPVGELGTGELVDRDVAPRRVVDGELGDVGEMGSLPRRIVVMHHRRSSRAHRRHRS